MEIFGQLFGFITDNSKKLSARTGIGIFALLVILFLDNSFGFSYYYNLDKKVSIVSNFETVLKDSSLSNSERKMLTQMRVQAISHKSLKDKLWDFVNHPNIQWSENKEFYDSKGWNLNYILSIITAACIPIIFGVTIIFVAIPQLVKERKLFDDSRWEVLVKVMGVLFCVYLIGIVEAKVFLSIPTLLNNIVYNYILNVICNIIIVLLLYFFTDALPKWLAKKKKQSANSTPGRL